jgi:hypothetical protein
MNKLTQQPNATMKVDEMEDDAFSILVERLFKVEYLEDQKFGDEKLSGLFARNCDYTNSYRFL